MYSPSTSAHVYGSRDHVILRSPRSVHTDSDRLCHQHYQRPLTPSSPSSFRYGVNARNRVTRLTGTGLFFQVSKIPTIVGVGVLATKKYFYSRDWAAANRNCTLTIEGVGNKGLICCHSQISVITSPLITLRIV